MADFDALIQASHEIDLKLILDLVPNHTSDRHPWFIESRSSRNSSKRDWYIWHDGGSEGGPPNNWLSEFGGSAWEYDSITDQYYYHAFLAQQPDLNWRNSSVRRAIHDVMRFWLRKGVDGFRVDVIWHLIKDDQFRDNPPNPDFQRGRPPNEALLPIYTTDRPEIHDIVGGIRSVIDEFDNRVLIGEIYLPVERLVSYYGERLLGAHMPFNFSLLAAPWNARALEKTILEYERALPHGAWPNWVLGNHDRPRIAGRAGKEQARVAAMLLLTLRGTPTLYYGDEIGMQQVAIAPEQVKDPFEKNIPGIGVGRDGCRTPMQWDATANAGFSTTTPWLPIADDFAHQNVANLDADRTSILSLYKALLEYRRKSRALTEGTYEPIAAANDLLIYERRAGDVGIVVILNISADPVSVMADTIGLEGEIQLSTHLDRTGEKLSRSLELRGNEGVLVRLRRTRNDRPAAQTEHIPPSTSSSLPATKLLSSEARTASRPRSPRAAPCGREECSRHAWHGQRPPPRLIWSRRQSAAYRKGRT
jgi:alpha-glucosidase